MKGVTILALFAIACTQSLTGACLQGTVSYSNSGATPVRGAKVLLCDSLGNRIDSVFTSQSGTYSFCDLAGGNYQLSVAVSHPWGGVNNADALLVMKHFVGMSQLSGLYLQAADVNLVFGVNSADAFLIQKRFVALTNTFPLSDWISDHPLVTLAGQDMTIQHIKVLCAGDVNGSYIPDNNLFILCGDTVTDTRDYRKYPTVLIGTQCWMKKNMNIGSMVGNTQDQSDNGNIEKYCYNNDPASCEVYGGLYQWNEMMQYSVSPGIQGICPESWVLPTDADWCTLTHFLDPGVNCNTTGWSGTNAGGKLKETGTLHWNPPNSGATNQSQFTALAAGNRNYFNGGFYNQGIFEDIWTSSQYSSSLGIGRGMSYDRSTITRNYDEKAYGLSARCMKHNYCTPAPSQPDAGPDQTIANASTTLAANTPASGTGTWAIVSGQGGSLSDPSSPNSQFSGVAGTAYTLEWIISNPCGSIGDQVNITLLAGPGQPCGGIPYFSYGNQTYNTVQIGTQCWMRENLNIGQMVTSTFTGWGHSDCSNNGIIEKYCYDNDQANCPEYGGLYDWDEMMQYGSVAGSRGICPSGWHIPTDGEWCTLTTYLDPTVNCSTWSPSGTNAGGKLKESGTVHWNAPNTGAGNESGFTALGAGYRYNSGEFDSQKIGAFFWSSSEYISTNAVLRYLLYASAAVSRGNFTKSFGYAVRCIKD